MERLAAADGKMQLVRVGHPARLLPQVRSWLGLAAGSIWVRSQLGWGS